MLRRSLWAAPAVLALAASAFARAKPKPRPAETPPSPPPPAPSLIGAWTLLSAETLQRGADPTPAFGDRVNGLLIYDQSGEMSLQIAGERPSVGSLETFEQMRPEDRMVFLDNYYAYFGTFKVDEAARAVVHRIRDSLRPNEIGATYRRQYQIEGDRLTLASPPEARAGEMVTSRLLFVRAYAPA
jgi:hypothetical protein